MVVQCTHIHRALQDLKMPMFISTTHLVTFSLHHDNQAFVHLNHIFRRIVKHSFFIKLCNKIYI